MGLPFTLFIGVFRKTSHYRYYGTDFLFQAISNFLFFKKMLLQNSGFNHFCSDCVNRENTNYPEY
jgi:hypothetical protein